MKGNQKMKNKIIPIITAMVLMIMAFFICKTHLNRHSWLPLNEISDVSIVDDGVIIIVLQDGNHYALEADGE